ncbi:MAG: N-acetylneuraminate synthase [Firmicutes bacterium]|nr:N-acetylneuraminate synthase [Bacillota bacterium]
MNRVYIIAEAGVNHNGQLDLAREMIHQAANAGVDAVKFQTFIAEEVISRHAPKAPYQEQSTPTGESQLEMVLGLQFDEAQHRDLLCICQSRGIEFISSPFDLASVDLLASRLKLPLIKVASGEITNFPLLLKTARTGAKILLSTGMCGLGDIENALSVLAFGYCAGNCRPSPAAFRESYSSPAGQWALKRKVTLLHCTSEYPAPFEEINLQAIDTLSHAFTLKVGYSDHSQGIVVPIAAAARGAVVIEKHFTLDRGLPGPDHQASLEPSELRAMVKAVRQVEKALGSSLKFSTQSESKNLPLVRKSLVARKDIRRGEVFTEDNLGIKRPGSGLSPIHYWDYLGRTSERDYQTDEEIV